MEGEREIVHETSHGVPEMLQTSSCEGISDMHFELGEISDCEDLLNLKKQAIQAADMSKRQRRRKTDNPKSFTLETVGDALCCQNSACKALGHKVDTFCKLCSCCICYKYDDYKDTSLWLVCSSDYPDCGDSCGFSCHLECALKHENTGITKDAMRPRLDGSFYCASCGKLNDLLG
ncbi:hypothetical protein GIB67_031879 [Kingdonia uniflora]|uniref:Oberon-like PHD finger domain-containing protein n=1 Tax=Kingdonia uniflora TaxID=39325 RepID=A0A7J7LGV4_9MAGN|nr:hypothetical protein GIB67_031879 [Kingdonia uniflora]